MEFHSVQQAAPKTIADLPRVRAQGHGRPLDEHDPVPAPPEVGALVARLRARRPEIERAIFARVRESVFEPSAQQDSEYLAGLQAAVPAALGCALDAIEQRGRPPAIPAALTTQARRAARNGVELQEILQRYILGHALLFDYAVQEAVSLQGALQGAALRALWSAHASLGQELVRVISREHVDERKRICASDERRLSEQVRVLLAGEDQEVPELDYELQALHVGVIARGSTAQAALEKLAQALGARLLSVPRTEGTVWGWLGGISGLQVAQIERALQSTELRGEVSLAVGEPAGGLQGWRTTHRQAQAAALVALRRPRRFTRYADVALLAAALSDQTLASVLTETYLTPLDGARGAKTLRDTLRAYLAAERNISSAAAALGVARSTVEARLSTIERRLGRSLHPCPAELEVALALGELQAGETGDVGLRAGEG